MDPDTPDAPEVDMVHRARAILRAVAAKSHTIGYGELREMLSASYVIPDRGPGDLASVLRAASEAEEAAGVGLVSAVVVGPSGRPGPGWYRLAAIHGREVSDREAAWEAERERLRVRLAP